MLLTITFFVLQMQGQNNDLLKHIRAIGQEVQSIEADLTNTKVKNGVTTTQSGTLHFVSPNEMAAVFTTGNHLIANEKKLKVDIGVLSGTYRLREGGIPKSLSNVFLYAFQGRCQDLADENNYTLKVTTSGQYHILTFTSKKKHILGLGFQKVIFKISIDDLRVKEITLINFKGTVDTFGISNEKYNVKIDKGRFKI